MVRGRNVDVAADPQEPHGQEVDTTVIIGRGQVRDEGHRKELVNLGGAKNWGLIFGYVRRVACHVPPPSSRSCF